MFEDMTYENIMGRMMDRIEEKYPTLDRREGSIIFNALAPSALEIAIMYTELENLLAESFIETASREYKIIGCEQMGIDVSIFDSHAGTFKGEFDVQVEIGSRWNCDLHNYTVSEYLGMNGEYHEYSMLCETEDGSANNNFGSLTPLSDIPEGLNYAELTECLIEGENESTDEEIVAYYKEFVSNNSTDGNVNQYKEWCNNYEGIGNSKVIPLWNGANTVKVSILSASNGVASDELVASFQEYLDPNCEGMGEGVAPIGAFVTVTTATPIPVTITANVTLQDGYTDTSIIDNALKDYFAKIAYEKSVLAYMSVGATILNVDGVESISNLKINNSTNDITLGKEEIPVLNSTNWSVV